jgi:hypothetical protein
MEQSELAEIIPREKKTDNMLFPFIAGLSQFD